MFLLTVVHCTLFVLKVSKFFNAASSFLVNVFLLTKVKVRSGPKNMFLINEFSSKRVSTNRVFLSNNKEHIRQGNFFFAFL